MGSNHRMARVTLAMIGACAAALATQLAVVPSVAAVTVSPAYTGAPVGIADGRGPIDDPVGGAPARASITVAGVAGPIADVDLTIGGSACSDDAGSTTVGIDHSFVGDLHIVLESPAGTRLRLVERVGGAGNNICQMVLDDEAARPVQSLAASDAPFTGSFIPRVALSRLDGEDPNGDWTLEVQDFVEFSTGSIRDFSLQIGTAPTVTIDQASGQSDPTVSSSVAFDVRFSEIVNGFDESDVDLAGSTVGGDLAVSVTGRARDFTVVVDGIIGDGSVVAAIPAGSVTSSEGFPNTASTSADNTVTVDDPDPSVTIEQAPEQPDPTSEASVLFTATFSETVTDFDATDVLFTGSTAAGSLSAAVSGTGTTFTIVVTGFTGDGTIVVSVPAGAAIDAAGQGSTASTSEDDSVTVAAQVPPTTASTTTSTPPPTSPSTSAPGGAGPAVLARTGASSATAASVLATLLILGGQLVLVTRRRAHLARGRHFPT